MTAVLVEMKCPEHGLERFKIKVVKKLNVKQNLITPIFRSRPTPGDLSCICVGRNVSDKEIEKYLTSYFRERGLIELILRLQMI